MASIVLSNHHLSYQVTHKLIASIRLRITSPSSFAISAPHFTPQFVIDKFITEHSDWIIKNLPSPKALPQTLSILDQEFKIITSKTSRDSVVIIDNEHLIYLNTSLPSESHQKKILNQKLRPHALKLINSELKQLKTLFPFQYQKVSIRNQSSRFGSCSSSGNLSFNWQIILFPYPMFRHIILHELTHTIHHDHSHRFWAQLAKFDPQFITHRYWLKKEANKFMLFS